MDASKAPTPSEVYRKSHNNLFGARLIWQKAAAAFVLENVPEGAFQPALALELRPQATVGSSPALTATLRSRSLHTVGGQPDSEAVITLSLGQVLRLSFGLLEAPQWLATTSPTAQ